jgi:ribose/xylose/arabinose/galactoside ABC-type transport system permease subunit
MTLAVGQPPQQATRRNYTAILAKLGPLLGLIAVFALFSILRPSTFLAWNNIEVMLLQTAVVGTAALGMTLIIISGGIDLSVGSNIALCTVAVAVLLNQNLPPALAALGGIICSALCGLLIGLLVTKLRLPPFIATLGLWGSLRGAAKGLAGETMVVTPDTWLNNLLRSVHGSTSWMILPIGVWIMLVLAVIVALALRYTRFGRHVFAVGSNEQTARLCGVAVDRTKLLVYCLGAAFAGVAGVLQYSYLTVGDPTTATGMELDIIAAVVIGGASLSGGQGGILGSLIGALLMTVVANGCTKVELANWVQEIVTGGIIIAAVTMDRIRHRKAT